MKVLGEENPRSLTPGLWRQASRNQLASFKKLCPATDPNDPAAPPHTHASEYGQHVVFFANLPYFEEIDMLPVWYPVEYKLRFDIYDDGIFDRTIYESRVEIAVCTFEQMRALGLTPITPAPPSLPGLPLSAAQKRSLTDDMNPAPHKQARNGRRDGRDRRGSTPASREGSVARECGPPTCIICTGPHTYDLIYR